MKHIVLIAPSRSGHAWTANMLRSWLPRDKVYQFEGIPPCLYKARVKINIWQGSKPKKDQPVIAIIQLRDFLNYAASIIKHMLNNGNAEGSRVVGNFDTWYDITREAFNDTRYIGEKYRLYYDHFVRNQAYRKGICMLLDGDYNEDNIDLVPEHGPGSSFDKYDYQGRGSQMKVLERWKLFLMDDGREFIQHLKARKNIVQYYADNFDLSQGQRQLVDYILK